MERKWGRRPSALRVRFELNTSITRVLDVVRVPNGRIMVDEVELYTVFYLQQGRAALRSAKEDRLITPPEAAFLETEMVEAGLKESMREVIAAFEQWSPPSDLTRTHRFERCSCDNQRPHGYILDDSGQKSGPILSVVEGLAQCDLGMESWALSPSLAAALVKEMAYPATGKRLPQDLTKLASEANPLLNALLDSGAIVIVIGPMDADEEEDRPDFDFDFDDGDDWRDFLN